jgi:flagellar motor switch protein FliG
MVELNSRQRAAAVLAQLDPERASAVLSKLSEAEAIALGAEMARLPSLDEDTIAKLATDLRRRLEQLSAVRGGEDVAFSLLAARLGKQRATEILDELRSRGRPRPFGFLAAVDATRLALFLEDEHPQLVAAVLTQLRHEHAAQVLNLLAAPARTEVARRVASTRGLSHAAASWLHDELQDRLLSIAAARGAATVTDGMDAIVGILTSVDQRTEKQVIEKLAASSPELAEEIRSRLFTFENLVSLEARSLQEILRRADHDTLVLALKGKPAEVVERFVAQLTERRATQLLEDLAALGPQHLRAVQEAEAVLVRLALRLDEEQVIQLNRSNDPMLE